MYNKQIVEELLKTVKGRVFKNFHLGKITFFKTGGNSDYFFIPKDINDLQYLLNNKPKEVPIFIIGNGSNLLVRDGGIKGITIKLSNLNNIHLKDNNLLWVEAGVLDKNLAVFAKNHSLSGLEFLYTIPGTLGGAIIMNAGAYNSEIRDIFYKARVLTETGFLHEISLKEAGFSYRSSIFKNNNLIIVGAYLKGTKLENSNKIFRKMNLMEQNRLLTQPLANEKTGGSTFKNPPLFKAWELIKKVGGEKLQIGGAAISTKHNNFLINKNNATAKNIEDLGELIRLKVKEAFNITLEWEIKIVGEFNN